MLNTVEAAATIAAELQRLQNMMDEYALPTSAIIVIESVMANLEELRMQLAGEK